VHMLGIRVVSLSGVALAAPQLAVFDEGGGDIGRSSACNLVLVDPERLISRHQALIVYQNGRHFIRQIGTNVDVELDGVALPLEVDCPIEPGAHIRIGPYVLRAENPPGTASPAPEAAHPAPSVEGYSDDDLLAAFSIFRKQRKQPTRRSVFDDLLHDPVEVGPDAIPPASATPSPPSTPAASSGPVFSDAGEQELDLVVGDPTGFIERRAAQRPSNGRQSKNLTAVELLSALYGGLGLPMPAPADQTLSEVRLIGALLRTSVEGLLALLTARTIAKRELGASATLPKPRENNPLKFSPDSEAALAHLLGPAQRGFVGPQEAVAEAFDDMTAHEVAVLAGMRASLNEVLARFDPASLEQRLAPKGRWENLLPGSRESKLWVQFSERYADIVREIEGDFDSLSARAFREAYEAQLDKLSKSK
jgi:type VI secretion system FHA domain protein